MTAVRILLAVAALLAAWLPAAAGAAGPELEAFDLRKCVRWTIGPAAEATHTAAYRTARVRARPPFQLFEAQGELPEGGTLRKYGACSLRAERRKLRLRCLPGLDFPLSAASYAVAEQQQFRAATTLQCISGCDQKIPDTVYLLRDRAAGDAPARKEDHARAAPFRRACAGLR